MLGYRRTVTRGAPSKHSERQPGRPVAMARSPPQWSIQTPPPFRRRASADKGRTTQPGTDHAETRQ